MICVSINLNYAPISHFVLMDHSAMTSIDVRFEMIRIAVACKFVHARLCVNVKLLFFFLLIFLLLHFLTNKSKQRQ